MADNGRFSAGFAAAAACSRTRTAVRWGVCFWLAVALLQTWFLDGLVGPCRIAGGSMAETLLGSHREVVCADCGYAFSCGTDVPPAAPRAVCPNCGYAANDPETPPDLPGERVLIDRGTFSVRPPRRWEVVAFRQPRHSEAIAVKRVVGLPGEAVDIRHGDVYIDGRVQRKSLLEQRALAVLVHDANFEPTRQPTPPLRWRAEHAGSGWTSSGGRFSHSAAPEAESTDWLGYHHWRRLMGDEGEVQESPVTDLCGYNQSQPRREEDVHAVADLLLSLRLAEVAGSGLFTVRATDGREEFEARLQFDENPPRYQLLQMGRPLSGMAGKIPGTRGPWLVEVSLVDQQFLLAINGETLAAWPYDRSGPASPPACPIAIGVRGLGVSVCDLRVFRDVYYTEPVGWQARSGGERPVRLAADQYFVLGDNSPVSEDSRTWPDGGAVDAKLLLGKPLVAIPSVQFAPWGLWYFQVPNLTRIRYIR